MVGLRRLVGWGLSSAFAIAWVSHARAQSTASFPADTPPRPTAVSPRMPPPPPRPLPASPYPSSRPAKPAPPKAAPRQRKPVPVTIPAKPERNLEPSPYPGGQASPTIVVPQRPQVDRSNPYGAPKPPLQLSAAPPILPYRKGMPVPHGYEVVHRPNSGLITGGVVGLGLTYGVALIVGASEGFENGTGWLAAPVVGPWGAIGARKYECKSATQTVAEAKKCVRAAVGEVQLITIIAVDGIAQLASVVVTIAGALSSHDELVRQDLVNVALIPPSDKREPWMLGLSGRF